MPWFRLLRPFTLLPPVLGMASGAVSALGSGKAVVGGADAAGFIAAGALMAALLNGASNVLNQVHDLELDRVNKPERPLPRGEVSPRAATLYAALLYALSLGLAFAIRPAGTPEIGFIVLITAFLTWAYSGPPLRWRRSWWLAPLVIAIPRGGLLKVAGWAAVAPVGCDVEPWILGGLFFLFLLGCASTKDFSDVDGDARGGVVTLPIRFGARGAACRMAPFYVVPWVLLGALPWIEGPGGKAVLSVAPAPAAALGGLLALQGAWTAAHLIRSAGVLSEAGRGKAAWRNLYLLMMEAQVGVAALYLF